MYLSPVDAIRASVQGAVDTWNRKDVAGFIRYWTDNGLKTLFETETVAEARALVPEFIGDPPLRILGFTDVVVSDRTAVGILDLAFGKVVDRTRNNYVLDGIWKIDSGDTLPAPIPSGVTAVDFRMQEFAFVYDRTALSSGNFALRAENTGKQLHEAVFIKIPSGPNLLAFITELFESESEDLPPGVEIVAFAGPYEPGDRTNIVFTEPLSAGRYALVCGIPDEASGLPHAALGMISEFTVAGGAGGGRISAPNTGDGGLAAGASGSGLNLAGVLAIAGLVLTIGVATWSETRKRA
jgi:hypothetical protein